MDWTLDCEHGRWSSHPKTMQEQRCQLWLQWSCGSDDVERKRGIAPELEIGQRDGWMRTCGVRNKYFQKDWWNKKNWRKKTNFTILVEARKITKIPKSSNCKERVTCYLLLLKCSRLLCWHFFLNCFGAKFHLIFTVKWEQQEPKLDYDSTTKRHRWQMAVVV